MNYLLCLVVPWHRFWLKLVIHELVLHDLCFADDEAGNEAKCMRSVQGAASQLPTIMPSTAPRRITAAAASWLSVKRLMWHPVINKFGS